MANQQLRRLLRRRPEMDEAEFELLQNRVLSRLTAARDDGAETASEDASGTGAPAEATATAQPLDGEQVTETTGTADLATAELGTDDVPTKPGRFTSIELPPTAIGVMVEPGPASWDEFAADVSGSVGLVEPDDGVADGSALDDGALGYEPTLADGVMAVGGASALDDVAADETITAEIGAPVLADDVIDDEASTRDPHDMLGRYRVPLDAGLADAIAAEPDASAADIEPGTEPATDDIPGLAEPEAAGPDPVASAAVPVVAKARAAKPRSKPRPSKDRRAIIARAKHKSPSQEATSQGAPVAEAVALPVVTDDPIDEAIDEVVGVAAPGPGAVAAEAVAIEPVIADAVEPVEADVAIEPVIADAVEPVALEPVAVIAIPIAPDLPTVAPRPSKDKASRPAAKRKPPSGRPSPRTAPIAAASRGPVIAASCPYCAMLLTPPPEVSRRCPRCRERIIVKRVDGRIVYLTEASVRVFDAERRRMSNAGRWTKERERWLKVAAAVDAPADRIARLAAALISEEVVTASRTLYTSTVERSFWSAKRDRRWEDASRIMREHAIVLYRIAGSPMPPPEEVLKVHRAGAAAALRGIGGMARDAELVGAGCCEICTADDGRTFRIADELRVPRLPHEGCPKGLCHCDWYLAVRDQSMVRRHLRRRARADARAGVPVETPAH